MTSNQENIDIEENDTNNNFNNKTIPLILDGTFFKIIRTKSENVQGECMTCKRRIKGRIDSTTNFLNHLKVKHLRHLASFSLILTLYFIIYMICLGYKL